MSSWGNLDNVAITANITSAVGSVVIANAAGNATLFTSEIDPGDYLIIASKKYQVHSVNSDVLLNLTDAVSTSGNVAFIQTGPKYISNINLNASNTYTIQRVFGVDKFEANVAENRARGFKAPGWNHHFSYIDANSQTRYKTEALVAMSKNFNANLNLALQTDATDDEVLADYQIIFITQPTNQSNTNGNAVTFTAVANTVPVGGVLTFQWFFSPNNIVFAKVDDGGEESFTGNDTATLVLSNVGNADGYFFFVSASTTDGADTANSSIVTANIA